MTATTPEKATLPSTFLQAEPFMAAKVPGYQSRPAQQALAAFIEQLIADCRPQKNATGEWVVEPKQGMAQAGTGTGKSLAALITAILSGQRVILSTSTIALMNQYLKKDLPLLAELLPVEFTYAQLKGIGQYLCRSKLAEATPEQVATLADLLAETTGEGVEHTGDLDELTTPLKPEERQFVTSGSNECPGKSSCAFGATCFGYQAKAKALESQIVVTNAKMAMLDIALQRQMREASEDGSEPDSVILGERGLQIFDEAHELPEIAADTLGFEFRQAGVIRWVDQAITFLNIHGGAEAEAEPMGDKIKLAMDKIGAVLAERIKELPNPTLDVAFFEEHFPLFEELHTELHRMTSAIAKQKIERGKKEEEDTRRKRLERQGDSYLLSLMKIIQSPELDMVAAPELKEYENKDGSKTTRWIVKANPIEVGEILREELWSRMPAIVMSATLSTGTQGFDYMARSLGLAGARTLDVGTPFDYMRQTLLYTPLREDGWSGEPIPEPVAKDPRQYARWQSWAMKTTYDLVVRAAKGGAMLLFTSKKDMQLTYATLASEFRQAGLSVYMQGLDYSNAEIAQRFKDEEDSVLFGLRTFMTGMDFAGNTNRLVVIMKMPFPVPTDPMYAARINKLKSTGISDWAAFTKIGIPMMMLTLLQAYGRLIRTTSDSGVVAVLDPRLNTTSYGKNIVQKGLPHSLGTHDVADVHEYFRGWREAKGIAA